MPLPPEIVNDGHRIVSSSFWDRDGPWMQARESWLDCHLGHLRLLYFGNWLRERVWNQADYAILTRGHGPDGEEMIEIYFPSEMENRHPCPIHLRRWQCNRLPGWKPGQRCWILDIYGSDSWDDTVRVAFTCTVFWREGSVPSRKPWEGLRQDGKPEKPKPREISAEEAQQNAEMFHRLCHPEKPPPAKPSRQKRRSIVDELRRRQGLE